jgi:hypothetical protein
MTSADAYEQNVDRCDGRYFDRDTARALSRLHTAHIE